MPNKNDGMTKNANLTLSRKENKNKRINCLLLPLFFTACLTSYATLGADWEIAPRVALDVIYTDNYFLESEEEDSEVIYEVRPGLTIKGEGGRTKLDLDYQLEAIRSQEENEVYHQLGAAGSLEVAKQLFFIDADARYFQSIIDPDQRIVLDNINPSQNRTDVLTANLAPYLTFRFAGDAEFLAKYRYGIVQYGDGEGVQPDSNIHEFLFRLGNLLSASRKWSWQLAAETSKTEADDESSAEFKSASASLGYRFTSRMQLVVDGGVDENDFAGEELADTSGPYWNASLRVGLGEKDLLVAGVGERYNGRVYNLLWRHEARRFSFGLTYDQSIDTHANVLSTQPVTADTLNLFRSDAEVFERKALTLDSTLKWPKSSLGVSVRHERRDSLSDVTEDQQVSSLSGAWNWRFGPRTQLNLSVLTTRQDSDGSDGEDKILNAAASLSRSFGSATTGSLVYTHTQQDSDDPTTDYEENRFRLSVVTTF